MTTSTARTEPHPGARAPELRLALWVVGIACVLAHLGLFFGGVWSFEPLNYDDPQVLALAEESSVPDIVRQPLWYAYKPVYFLSLKFDTLFGSATSGVAHVHNLLLHVVASLLLVVLLSRLLRSTWIAGAVGLLFAVHPVHVESVAWIASRKDLLSFVFVLLAHLAYRGARDKGRLSFAAPVLLLLGGLTKGTVWIWTGVLALDEVVELLRARAGLVSPEAGRALLRLLPCAFVSLLGIAVDGIIATTAGPGAVEHGVSTLSLVAASAGVHARYVLSLIVPAGLSIDYAVDPAGSWASPFTWIGVALLVLAGFLLIRSWRRGWTPGVVAAGLWLLGLLPVNNVWPRTSILMADRYLYVPAIGVYVLLVALLARWRPGRVALVTITATVLLALAVVRTGTFRTSETVWADATAKEPESALAWVQRGHDAATRGAWRDANTYADRAVACTARPEIEVRAWLLRTQARLGELGSRVDRGGRVAESELRDVHLLAEESLRRANALEGKALVRTDAREVRSEALVLHGRVLELLRDPASALEMYERATDLWADNATAHYNLATLLAQTGSAQALGAAERHLRQALALRPGFLEAELQIAIVLARQARIEEALDQLDRAVGRYGRTPEILYMMARIHLEGRQEVEVAVELLHELRRHDPNHPKASRLLGQIHLTRGRLLLEAGRAESDRTKLRGALHEFDAAAHAREGWWEPEVWAGDMLVHLVQYRAARERYVKALEQADVTDWIERLVARAAFLEAARTARYAEDDAERREAAWIVGDALRREPSSIDLGYLAFHEELAWLRRASARLDAHEGAGRVLRAAALAATGDVGGARRELRGVFTTLSPDTEEKDVLDAALLLRGMLRARASELDLARRDYASLAKRRPSDPLPALRVLELALREAQIHHTIALGDSDDVKGRLEAAAAVREAGRALSAFADDHPELLSAGRAATQTEIDQGRYVAALKRLNTLKARFPREPAVWRGESAIYATQYLQTRDATLLAESARALGIALMFDPRDPQVLLDASQVARLAGQMKRALGYAREARTYELSREGPAARALCDLHVAYGRQALEAGKGGDALQAAAVARQADPGSAGPWVLEGDVYLRARKPDEAFVAYANAVELEPLSEAASAGMARIHWQRAKIIRVRAASMKPPPPPETVDSERWAGLSEEEQREERIAWQESIKQYEARKSAWNRQLRRELEAALRLDPASEDADRWARLLRRAGQDDPAEQKRRYEEAKGYFETGRAHYESGRLAKALADFQRATDLFPNHHLALYYSAVVCHQLLQAPSGESDEEKNLEAGWWAFAFDSLHALDKLDTREGFPDRHQLRGQLNDLRWRRAGQPYAQLAAVRAYERYLHAMQAAGRDDEPAVGRVRQRLKELR